VVSRPQVIQDRYELQRRIGVGSVADVYLAIDGRSGRRVAVKLLHPPYAQRNELVERFEREALAAAALHDANVVTLHDWGTTDGTYYLVMDYVNGPTLRELLGLRGALPERQAADIGQQAAAALGVIHHHGMVHGDVTPQNILLDPHGTVKLTPFNLARVAGLPQLVAPDPVSGMPPYMSPEQARGGPVDARSDLYSLGVVLYELLTGQVPFAADDVVGVAPQPVNDDPRPPRDLRPELSTSVDALVLKALHKDPAARYQTADAMRADLEEVAGGAPQRTIAVVNVPVEPGPDLSSRPPLAESDAAERTARLAVRKEARPVAQELGHPSDRRRALVAGALLFPLALLVAAVVESTSAPLPIAAPPPQPEIEGVAATTEQPSPTMVPQGTAEVLAAIPPTSEPSPPPATVVPPSPMAPPAARSLSAQPPPAAVQPPEGADSPAAAVTGFYQLVDDHRFGEAATMWSPRMQASYPPAENITGRFSRT
jgi:hypothetical protein